MCSSNILDSSDFAHEAEAHRRALHVHCYRMLGSFEEAEDVVQESLLRAWRQRDSVHHQSAFRSWLYRIATNVCIDSLRRSSRRVLPSDLVPPNTGPEKVPAMGEVQWLQPYPDRLLDEVGPEEQVIARETIQLTFIAAIQLLPARQRAALLIRDVLGWSAQETAAVLETSIAAVNSMVQRARATLQRSHPTEWSFGDAPEVERALLARFMEACEHSDAMAVVDLLADDVRCMMPPYEWWFDGKAEVLESLRVGWGPGRPGEFRLIGTSANRQPAVAAYVRVAGEAAFHPFAVDVLQVRDGRIVSITAFHLPGLFTAFGLPSSV